VPAVANAVVDAVDAAVDVDAAGVAVLAAVCTVSHDARTSTHYTTHVHTSHALHTAATTGAGAVARRVDSVARFTESVVPLAVVVDTAGVAPTEAVVAGAAADAFVPASRRADSGARLSDSGDAAAADTVDVLDALPGAVKLVAASPPSLT
jgi:hypothetical protein